MDKIERVSAVVEGRRPDRPPVSFWYHFGPGEVAGPAALEAHLRHVETYDLDFLKVMNDNRYPAAAPPDGVFSQPSDLERLTVLAGDEDGFGRQLELLRALRGRLAGRLRMTTTIFNAWSTLRRLTGPDQDVHGPPRLEPAADPRDAAMSGLLRTAPEALARALDVIAQSLANFARGCLAAGADGVYLSVRDDWVDCADNGPGVYDRLVRPGDLKILAAAAAGTFNVLHVCGTALDFERFAAYPAQVLHWADRLGGPAIAAVAGRVRPALCAGVDNLRTMVKGTPEDCRRQVLDALAQAGGRPILIAPGCTYDPAAVPAVNLHAIRRAVESAPA
jgi:uroporphyrinogen decarboxylase